MRFFLAPVIIVLLMQPAYSQSSIEADELKVARERKELEQQHKAIMDILPDQKKKSSDPWKDLRGSELPKKKPN